MIDSILQYTWLGIPILLYLEAMGLFLGTLLVLKLFQLVILRKIKTFAKKTVTDVDDSLISVIDNIRSSTYIVVSVYVGLRILPLEPHVWKWINTVVAFIIAESAIRTISQLIRLIVEQYLRRRFGEEDVRNKMHTQSIIRMMQFFIVFGLWVTVLLLILSNLGFNVTSMVASLGIGGIAVALAVQNLLSDIFSSFSILIDKPFEVGDFIKIGQDVGTVQKIGMKTTRIKTLRGEELVVSNKELTTVRIQNFKTLDRRREQIDLSITYETAPKLLEEIPELVKQVVEPIEDVDFGRCHLRDLGATALIYEVIVFVNTEDYERYMEIKQAINLGLIKIFAKKGIEFAYPTQTIYTKK